MIYFGDSGDYLHHPRKLSALYNHYYPGLFVSRRKMDYSHYLGDSGYLPPPILSPPQKPTPRVIMQEASGISYGTAGTIAVVAAGALALYAFGKSRGRRSK